MKFEYDVIVVGAGHAGCEAAVAAAKLGASTLLITADLNRVAQMSCNPAVGGIAKGQIVREIDALGGMMGIVADHTAIQFKMLNRSKGPAVWSPRVQSDRTRFIDEWRRILDSTPGLYLFQDMVTELIIDDATAVESVEDTDSLADKNPVTEEPYVITMNRSAELSETSFEITGRELKRVVRGVKTSLGFEFIAKKVILTAGTFLNGLMHFGRHRVSGGRIAEPASDFISDQLKAIGFAVGRMKTGTPARIDGRTIDFSLTEMQMGDDRLKRIDKSVNSDNPAEHNGNDVDISSDVDRSSDENRKSTVTGEYIGEEEIVCRDFHKFSFLPAVGRKLRPRACYIVHTSPEVHQELRENLADSPLYNGQIQSIGPRYCPIIETKIVTFPDKDSHQLFLEPEGETTEEYYINGFSSSLPWRVQIDALSKIPALRDVHFYRPGYAIEYDYFDPTQLTHDLQTKLVSGLYFAGQVNGTTGYEEAAAQGLMAGINAARSVAGKAPVVLGRDKAYIGVLIDDLVTKGTDEPYRMFTSRAEYRILLRQDDADMRLTPLGYEIGLADYYRYELMINKREERDSLMKWCADYSVKPTDAVNGMLEEYESSPISASIRLIELLKRPRVTMEALRRAIPAFEKRVGDIERERRDEILEAVEILVKYGGKIDREAQQAEKMHRLEHVRIPAGFDYSGVKSLSTESRQKLAHIRPETIGQASRIPGVSPADISVLLILLGR